MTPQEPVADLNGVRVLLLEDEALVNMNTVELLEKMGCEAVGYLHLDDAWDAARRAMPDVAVLDVNLHDVTTSLDFADWLHEKGVPIGATALRLRPANGGTIPNAKNRAILRS
jgi:DNA-binding NarL/FixJ family response regulator